MTSDICLSRLRKELRQIQKNPIENIYATCHESNLLVWHYCLIGAKDSCYQGGYYHGVLTFPAAYPFKPPSIKMMTPNGRFEIDTRLCLSMSDFHPETWDPMWSVGTILMGLYSFMHDTQSTLGSIQTTDAFKRKAAIESLAYNCNKSKLFCELFPELKELFDKRIQEKKLLGEQVQEPNDSFSSSHSQYNFMILQQLPMTNVILISFLVVVCSWLLLYLSLN